MKTSKKFKANIIMPRKHKINFELIEKIHKVTNKHVKPKTIERMLKQYLVLDVVVLISEYIGHTNICEEEIYEIFNFIPSKTAGVCIVIRSLWRHPERFTNISQLLSLKSLSRLRYLERVDAHADFKGLSLTENPFTYSIFELVIPKDFISGTLEYIIVWNNSNGSYAISDKLNKDDDKFYLIGKTITIGDLSNLITNQFHRDVIFFGHNYDVYVGIKPNGYVLAFYKPRGS